MDTSHLKSFIAVARTLNFTEAARQNFITQPAISRQMKELEETLGVKLIHRTRQSVTLTEEGSAFLRFAEEQLENEREIRSILQNLSQGNLGMIRIATLPNLAFDLMACLSDFNREYPSIQLTIDQVSGGAFGTMLTEREHHFYFGNVDSFTSTHGISYLETHEEHLVMTIHKKDLGRVDPDDVATYANLPFAFISHDIGPVYTDGILSFCTKMGYNPLFMCYFNSAEAIMLAVNAGIAISIMPETMARAYKLENVELLRFSRDSVWMVGAVGWREERINEAAAKFLEIVKKRFLTGGSTIHHT